MGQRRIRRILIAASLVMLFISSVLVAGASGEPVKLWVFVTNEAVEEHVFPADVKELPRNQNQQNVRQNMLSDVRRALAMSRVVSLAADRHSAGAELEITGRRVIHQPLRTVHGSYATFGYRIIHTSIDAIIRTPDGKSARIRGDCGGRLYWKELATRLRFEVEDWLKNNVDSSFVTRRLANCSPR